MYGTKKYKFTGKTINFEGRTLKQVKYLKDTIMFSRGDIGGWIESESNLSHEGMSCVMDDAKVFGNAKLKGDARVLDNACIKDNVELLNSIVKHNAIVKDNANINNCIIEDYAIVGVDTTIIDSFISGNSEVYLYATSICENPTISKKSVIRGNSHVEGTGNLIGSFVENKEVSGHFG